MTYIPDLWSDYHDESWRRTSSAVANGIQGSGLIEGLGNINENLFTLSAATADGLAGVQVGLATIAGRLGSIEASLSDLTTAVNNPRAAAAGELYRNGLFALQSGWVPEAVAKLTEAAELSDMDPAIRLNLGIAHSRNGNVAAAADALARAHRYARDQWLAAQAAILAGQALGEIGRERDAREILTQASDAVPNCAELALAAARSSGELSYVERAIRLAPELAPIAVTVVGPQAAEVAQKIAADGSGPVHDAVRADQSLVSLRRQLGGGEVLGFDIEPDRASLSGHPSVSLPAAGAFLDALSAAWQANGTGVMRAIQALDSRADEVDAIVHRKPEAGRGEFSGGCLLLALAWAVVVVIVGWVVHDGSTTRDMVLACLILIGPPVVVGLVWGFAGLARSQAKATKEHGARMEQWRADLDRAGAGRSSADLRKAANGARADKALVQEVVERQARRVRLAA